MKGEERVRDVTEADTARRGARAWRGGVSEEVSSWDARRPPEAGLAGFLLGLAVVRGGFAFEEKSQAQEKGIWWMPWH